MALRRSLDVILARHEALRSVFSVSQTGEAQLTLLPEDTPFPMQEYDLRGHRMASLATDPASHSMSGRNAIGTPAEDPAAALRQHQDEEAATPFDLAHGPLIRARLIRLSEDRHVFLLTQHHIVSDGWSVGRLLAELRTLYADFTARHAPSLAPLEIHYPDYAAWQRQWLDGERLRTQTDYWRERLSGAPALLSLPLDRPRPPRPSFNGAALGFHIDASLTTALRQLSQRHDCTLFTTMLTAWSAVLSRLSGQDDIVIGTPVANRRHPQLDPLIGFFVNVLALRIKLGGDCPDDSVGDSGSVDEHTNDPAGPSISGLLLRVRETTLGAQEHQDLPFEHVVELVNPSRRLDCSPVFQAMFSWQNRQEDALTLPGLTASDAPGLADHFPHVKFDIELNMTETSDGIEGLFNYASDLFDAETIARHRDYLLVMLRIMGDGTQADRPVAKIDLLPAAERNLLVHTWNATQTPYPETQCIHQLFEAQALRTPDAIALMHAASEASGNPQQRGNTEIVNLSYRALNQQANQLARTLIEAGVHPDVRVALCVQRSPAMVIALLAILKAGGAYVPMDPAYPRERLSELLDDAQPLLLLCDTTGRHAIGEAADAFRCIAVDATASAPPTPRRQRGKPTPAQQHPQSDASVTNPTPEGLTSHHLAYIIYTSGSTGKPKGVMIEHHSVVNSILWQADQCDVTAKDVCLHHTSLAFDIALCEIMIPLVRGARLAIAPVRSIVDLHERFHDIVRFGVTWTFNVPSALAFLIEDLQKRPQPALRYLLTGGEALGTPQLLSVQQYRQLANKPNHEAIGHVDFTNAYGPTETTIASVAWHCPEDFAETTVPIGRPIANTHLYVLDAHAQLAPLGTIGELYIGGAGVARGYLHRPELSVARFLPDTFSRQPGARMYRTGDLVRYRPDGKLLFIGRCDHQVKVRGFRIELGEIETRLAQHPRIRDAVVVDVGDTSGEKRLVAYVVARLEEAVASTNPTLPAMLHTHLSAQLPDYMVPSAFVQLDALPRTSNGKLDRHALPKPDGDAWVQRYYAAPQGDIESTLAEIWQTLLGVARIGRSDHFFELGGHSLLAMRFVGMLHQRLGVSLPLATLFTHPVLSELAVAVQKTRGVSRSRKTGTTPGAADPAGHDPLPDISPVSRKTPMVISPIQSDLLEMFADPALLAEKTIPVFLTIKGTIDIARWLQALNRIYARHDALRFTFAINPDAYRMSRMTLLSPEEGMPFAFHDLREYSHGKTPIDTVVDKTCLDAAFRPFDVARGPLIRATLVQYEDQRFVFVLSIHHLIADGWSLGVLMQEIGTLYKALSNGASDPLPALPIQYEDYAAWAHERARSSTTRSAEAYWQKRLSNAPLLSKPLQGATQQSYLQVAIAKDTVQALRRYAKEQNVTLFMVLLSAWAVLLGRVTQQTDVLIASPSANRRHPDTIPLIGFFATTLPLRIDLRDDPSPQALLKRVRDCVLEAQDHQDLPLNQIQTITERAGRPKGMPLCVHGFNLPTYTAEPPMDGLQIEKRTIDTPSRYSPLQVGLGMEISEYKDAIHGFIAYPSHVKRAVVERYHQQFIAILQACLNKPDQAVSHIEVGRAYSLADAANQR